MRRFAFVASAVLFASAVSIAIAAATPPTGQLTWEDYARAQVVEGATVPITAGSTLVRGSYSVAPAGDTGWRRLPGTTVLAVTRGSLVLYGGEGCAAKEYAAGKAAVIPAGVYLVHNPGSGPLDFFGIFFEQPEGAAKPLVEGRAEEVPPGCGDAKAAGVSPSGVSVATSAAGIFVSTHYSHEATLEIEAGTDMFATRYDASPEWSSGWFAHYPAVNIMEAGELTYVEAKDGKCDDSERYRPPDSFYHPRHRHIAANYGKEHVLITTMYFNLPHGESLPGPAGNQLVAADFSQAPPADCPRLR